MSYIGKNIKKIRTVKKLNQQAFAELFGLSRANIGSYEEGRAEPKINVIVEIANKFRLDVESLLNKELKVNEISKFKGIVDENLLGDTSFNPDLEARSIPFVSIRNREAYLNNLDSEEYLQFMPKFEIPYFEHKRARAFQVLGNEMLYKNQGLHDEDIVIGIAKNANEISLLKEGLVYAVVLKESILIRRLNFEKSCFVLSADNSFYQPIEIELEQIEEMWEAHTLISSKGGMLSSRFPV